MLDNEEWNINWSHGGVPIDLIKPKLLVIGYGRHGKDTVSEILCREMGLNYQSSSEFCAGHVMFPTLSKKYGYKDVDARQATPLFQFSSSDFSDHFL